MSTVPKYCISSKQYMVHIGDPSVSDIYSMMKFIEDAGLSFVSVEDLDVSDVTVYYDILRTYIFAKEEDALLFTLKFKGVAGND